MLTLVKVVDPEAIRICLTRLWNRCMDSSSTLKKHWAVRSFVTLKKKKKNRNFSTSLKE